VIKRVGGSHTDERESDFNNNNDRLTVTPSPEFLTLQGSSALLID